ncbi:toll/interleukin-1 receptor domain-containing protein [Leptolyngbya boryana]
MRDVFISYSRKDKPFVEQLHQALEAQNQDAWVDWEDIPRANARKK